MLKSIIAGQDEAVSRSAEQTPLVRWALASLSLSVLLSSLGTSIANVALPNLAQAFNASFQEVQWIVLAYLLTITTLLVSVGRLGDITGRRRLLLAGIFLFTVASVLCCVAPTLWLLIAARALQGLGGRSFGPLNVALLFVAACGVCFFVFAEARAISPLIRLATFRNLVLSASLAMSMLVSTVMMATLVVGPFYLSRSLGLDAALVGLVLSVGPLVAALTAAPAGRIADRFGAQRMTIVGLIGMAAGSFTLSMLPTMFGIPGYIAPIVVITCSYALFQTANNTAVMTDLSPDQRGAISGMLNLSRNLGLITGASVMGAVFALASATTDIITARPEAVATGMRITFAVAAALIVVALAIAAGARPGRPITAIRPLRATRATTRRGAWRSAFRAPRLRA